MTAPTEARTRTEWAVRYPDGHREALYSDGAQPRLPAHAWHRDGRLVRREVGDWVEVPT